MRSNLQSRFGVLASLVRAPAAGIYAAVACIRNFLFDWGIFSTFISPLPVVCVGNISVGGTGKTPLVRYLAQQLRERGERPVVLSRGYGGSLAGPWQVRPEDTYAEVGDEPAMLALDRNLPVVVARSRVAGAKYIQEQKLGSVILLDDGYQHRWLYRDVNIVCINASTPGACQDFIAGRMLPLGSFREPRAAALSRASLAVLSSRSSEALDRKAPEISRLIETLPTGLPWTSTYLGTSVVQQASAGTGLAPQAVTAICAIANPEGYFRTLTMLGFSCRIEQALPDHSARIEEACRAALSSGSDPIVVTEKDAMRLSAGMLRHERMHILRVSLVLESPDLVMQKIEDAISAKRNAQ